MHFGGNNSSMDATAYTLVSLLIISPRMSPREKEYKEHHAAPLPPFSKPLKLSVFAVRLLEYSVQARPSAHTD